MDLLSDVGETVAGNESESALIDAAYLATLVFLAFGLNDFQNAFTLGIEKVFQGLLLGSADPAKDHALVYQLDKVGDAT